MPVRPRYSRFQHILAGFPASFCSYVTLDAPAMFPHMSILASDIETDELLRCTYILLKEIHRHLSARWKPLSEYRLTSEGAACSIMAHMTCVHSAHDHAARILHF